MKPQNRNIRNEQEAKMKEMKALQLKAQEEIQRERSRQTPVYLGDVETMLQRVASHVPLIDNEAVYLAELETQGKFFLAFSIMGALMFILGIML